MTCPRCGGRGWVLVYMTDADGNAWREPEDCTRCQS